MHAILQKMLPGLFGRIRDASGYGSKGQYGSSGPGKGSYFEHTGDRGQKSAGSLPFGMITKSMDVKITRTERSDQDSDVELVDRPSPTDAQKR